MTQTAIICPMTLEDFEVRVQSFAARALKELESRYAAEERGFTVELLLDRCLVRNGNDGRRRVPLKYFQDLFYDAVNPEVADLPHVETCADYQVFPGDPMNMNIMYYRIIVD